VAGNIVVAWLLTLPAAAGVGALVFGFTDIFGGDSAIGPVVVSSIGIALVAAAVVRRLRQGAPVPVG
jgi:hypothetical protein